MATSDLLNEQTALIEESNSILKMLADRTGQYVWKKHEYEKKNVSLKFTYASSTTIKVTSSDVDLTAVDASFFVGFSGTWYNGGSSFSIQEGNIFNYGTGTFTYTYDPTTQIIALSGVLSSSSFSYSVNKTEKEILSFLTFVTADDENSYPNGGLYTDGYYYIKFDPITLIAENIKEGVDIWGVIGTMSEGVKGVAYGEITLSSNSNTITAQHNLGVKPTIYGAQIKTLVSTGTVFIDREYVFRRRSGNMEVVGAYSPTLSANSMTIGGGNAFPAGSTVVWYAIAI